MAKEIIWSKRLPKEVSKVNHYNSFANIILDTIGNDKENVKIETCSIGRTILMFSDKYKQELSLTDAIFKCGTLDGIDVYCSAYLTDEVIVKKDEEVIVSIKIVD